jgi:hypothetical protein
VCTQAIERVKRCHTTHITRAATVAGSRHQSCTLTHTHTALCECTASSHITAHCDLLTNAMVLVQQQLSSLATLKRKGNEHKVSTFAVGACGLRRGSLASVRKTQSRTNPQMAISVLGALTAPVVAIAALGTLDGFGKMILNLPRILEYQLRYASRLMEQGSGTTGVCERESVRV